MVAHESANLRPVAMDIVLKVFLGPKAFGRPEPDEETLKELKEKWDKELGKLGVWLKHRGTDYLTGPDFTVGDSNNWVFINRVAMQQSSDFTFEGHDEVKAWFERCSEQKGPTKSMAGLLEGLKTFPPK